MPCEKRSVSFTRRRSLSPFAAGARTEVHPAHSSRSGDPRSMAPHDRRIRCSSERLLDRPSGENREIHHRRPQQRQGPGRERQALRRLLTCRTSTTFKDFEGSSHRILIELIRRWTPRGGTLLDLGASAGELGAAVRDHFDRTIGFEYEVAASARWARRFDQVAIADLETIRACSNVDAIVLADVLEHSAIPPRRCGSSTTPRRQRPRLHLRPEHRQHHRPPRPPRSASSNTATAASSTTPICASTPSAPSAAKSKTPASASSKWAARRSLSA